MEEQKSGPPADSTIAGGTAETTSIEPAQTPIRVVVRPPFGRLVRQILGNVLHWVGGQLLISFLMTLFYAVGFALAGLPWWPLFALLNGLLHLVPMFGAALGLMLPFFGWLLLSKADPWMLFWIVVVYAVAQGVEGFYLTPKILGYHLRLKPFLVFLAVVLGSSLFGFVGALFAAPVAAIAMTVWRWWYDHRPDKQQAQGPGK